MKPYYNYFVSESGEIYNASGKKLRQGVNHKGYLHVSLRVNKKPHTKTVHRIVAETYIPNPLGLSDVDHIDGIKTNNSVTNLRWLSHGDNIRHCYALENRSARGENNARALVTEQVVHEICRLLQRGIACAEIRDMGYPYVITRSIRSKKNWRHISKQYSW